MSTITTSAAAPTPPARARTKTADSWRTGLVVGSGLAALSMRPSALQRGAMAQTLLTAAAMGAGMLAGIGIDQGLVRIADRTGISENGARAAALGVGLLASAVTVAARRPFPYSNTIDAVGRVVGAGAAAGLAVQAHDAVSQKISERVGAQDRFATSTLMVAAETAALLGVVFARRRINARLDPTTPSVRAVARASAVTIGLTAGIAAERTWGDERVAKARSIFYRGAGAAAVAGAGWFAAKKLRGGPLPTPALTTSVQTVSGRPDSLIDIAKLSPSAVAYLDGAVPAATIARVMGEPAVDPRRVYVGLAHAADEIERADLGIRELDRLNVFGRWGVDDAGKPVLLEPPSVDALFVTAPPGAGRVDSALMSTAEFATRGRVASVALQYSNRPSFLSLNRLDKGAAMYRHFLAEVDRRVQLLPQELRPKKLGYGNSLGAWALQDAADGRGLIEGLRALDRSLNVGTPGMSGLYRDVFYSRNPKNVADRAVAFQYSDVEELAAFARTPEFQQKRFFFHTRTSDPVPKVDPQMLWRRPLTHRSEFRDVAGTPKHAVYAPGLTFMQTLSDIGITAAISDKPAMARFGHTYHTDIVDDVLGTLFPGRVNQAQKAAIIREIGEVRPANVIGAQP